MKKIISFLVLFILYLNIGYSQSYGDLHKSAISKFFAGQYLEAIQDCNLAIEILKDTVGENIINKTGKEITLKQVYCLKGNSKSKLEDYRGVIQDYNNAIEFNFVTEERDRAFLNRGIAKGNIGDYKGAINDFDKAINLTPKFANAYALRGSAKFQLGNKEGACLDWSKAGELGYSKAYDKIKEFCN